MLKVSEADSHLLRRDFPREWLGLLIGLTGSKKPVHSRKKIHIHYIFHFCNFAPLELWTSIFDKSVSEFYTFKK